MVHLGRTSPPSQVVTNEAVIDNLFANIDLQTLARKYAKHSRNLEVLECQWILMDCLARILHHLHPLDHPESDTESQAPIPSRKGSFVVVP